MRAPGAWGLLALALAAWPAAARAQAGTLTCLAPGVYFHEGDHALGTCNNGWVVMDDYVVVVDANYPVGARTVMPKIRALTAKPVRFVIDTHFHPDHASGNQVWFDAFGAVAIAQAATRRELEAGGAAAWNEQARLRPDVAESKLRLPEITFERGMAIADAHHRLELRWPGPAHTPGDTLVWLPQEKILFTGDVCVNGSFNYLHDCDLDGWIRALEAAKALGARIVCPGHGPLGGPEIVADQEAYFVALRSGVEAMVARGLSAEGAQAAAPELAARLRTLPSLARYVPTDYWFGLQVATAYSQRVGRAAR